MHFLWVWPQHCLLWWQVVIWRSPGWLDNCACVKEVVNQTSGNTGQLYLGNIIGWYIQNWRIHLQNKCQVVESTKLWSVACTMNTQSLSLVYIMLRYYTTLVVLCYAITICLHMDWSLCTPLYAVYCIVLFCFYSQKWVQQKDYLFSKRC